MKNAQQKFLNTYLDTLSKHQRKGIKAITVEHFCANQKDADTLAQLVKDGRKTATCSLKYWYDDKNTDLIPPQVDNLMLVTDYSGIPFCIIQTISVEIKRFCDVDAGFSYFEGEGDRTLNYWKKIHRKFFIDECKHVGIEFDECMLLYLERFKVVFKA